MHATTDRHLLAIKPELFNDAQWPSQRRLQTAGMLLDGKIILAEGGATRARLVPGFVLLFGQMVLSATWLRRGP